MNFSIEEAIKQLGKPSLQNYLPVLDETAKSLDIRWELACRQPESLTGK